MNENTVELPTNAFGTVEFQNTEVLSVKAEVLFQLLITWNSFTIDKTLIISFIYNTIVYPAVAQHVSKENLKILEKLLATRTAQTDHIDSRRHDEFRSPIKNKECNRKWPNKCGKYVQSMDNYSWNKYRFGSYNLGIRRRCLANIDSYHIFQVWLSILETCWRIIFPSQETIWLPLV